MIPSNLIKSAEKIPAAKLSDNLSAVLAKTESSHEIVLIMDRENLEGIVSASYALFKKRLPLSTKASHALKKVPKLKQDTSLYEIARQMLSLDVYTLPIFGIYGDILGVIRAYDILDYLKNDKNILMNLKADEVTTKNIHDKIRDIYKILKDDKSSRIVIVDDKNKILGIISRMDIQKSLVLPTKGRRVKNKNNRTFIIDDKDLKKLDYPLGEFMKTNVNTISEKASANEIIQKMISGKTNSIVLVDELNKPKKIISINNILSAIFNSKPEELANFSLTDHHKVLVKEEKEKITNLTNFFANKIGKSKPIKNLQGEVSAYHNKKGKITEFEYHFHVYFYDGQRISAKVEDKVLWNAIKKAMEKVQNQLKRIR